MLGFAHAQLEVAEACSGIRSISAFTVLSVVFAYLLTKMSRRIVLVSITPLAMFTNIIRITGTGILLIFTSKLRTASCTNSQALLFLRLVILFLFEFSFAE